MKGKNYGICHSCRQVGHWFNECQNKRRCHVCEDGYVRWFEVEKISSKYRGMKFFSCTVKNCRFFEWDEGESSNEKSVEAGEDGSDDLAALLKTCARVSGDEDAEISVSFTIRKNKARHDDKLKGHIKD